MGVESKNKKTARMLCNSRSCFLGFGYAGRSLHRNARDPHITVSVLQPRAKRLVAVRSGQPFFFAFCAAAAFVTVEDAFADTQTVWRDFE